MTVFGKWKVTRGKLWDYLQKKRMDNILLEDRLSIQPPKIGMEGAPLPLIQNTFRSTVTGHAWFGGWERAGQELFVHVGHIMRLRILAHFSTPFQLLSPLPEDTVLWC